MSTATERYIDILSNLKNGDRGLLRSHAGQGIDESVEAFDLFAGLWWPLREKSAQAPRREVAWLVAKLFAHCPIAHEPGALLARQLRRRMPRQDPDRTRYRLAFDALLQTPLAGIEPALQWALREVADLPHPHTPSLDWVKLTDDLSLWDRKSVQRKKDIRLIWAEQFLDQTPTQGDTPHVD